MPTVSVPESRAKSGVKIQTNRSTTIRVELASIEILVGGPYEKMSYGHTALRVISAQGERIFDYGRYRGARGIGGERGDGILNIWTDFDTYIDGENSLLRKTKGFLYDIPQEKATEIFQFYGEKIVANPPFKAARYRKSYVIEEYFALGPNCTTISVAAAAIALPQIDANWEKYQEGRGLSTFERTLVSAKGWPRYTFMPGDLDVMLTNSASPKPHTIRTYQLKK